MLAVASAGCATSSPVSPAARATPVKKPVQAAPRVPSARGVLMAYLDATLAGDHLRAWGYLSADDRDRLPRDAYVRRERANDRLRAQVRALGPFRYTLESLREKGSDATAIVILRSGLGSERVRFALKREGPRWVVLYASSWSSAE